MSFDNNPRRDFLKKVPLGLGLAAGVGTGLIGLDSFKSPASAEDIFSDGETSGLFYSDFAEQYVRITTWKTGTGDDQRSNMQIFNQHDALIYTGALKTWRIDSAGLHGLDGITPKLFNADGNVAWEDTGDILLDGLHHDHERRLDGAPLFNAEYRFSGVSYTSSVTHTACFGRLRWREYSATVGGVTTVGAIEFHTMDSAGGWTVNVTAIQDNGQGINTAQFDQTLTLLETLRYNWDRFYTTGGVTGVTLGSTAAYFAGAVTWKGGVAAAAAGTPFVPAMACLGFLSIIAGAGFYYRYDQVLQAIQQLAFIWDDSFS